MTKKPIFSIAILTALWGAYSCNSDSDDYSELINDSIAGSNVEVKAFSLTENKSVLASLDTVFFSIDLINAQIFNADSLPFGTNVSRLVTNITYGDVSVAELTFKRDDGTDSVVDYLTHSTDSINFATGPAKFRLVSYDGSAERTYTIKVNVHKMKPDSLTWDAQATTALPSDLQSPTAQKTINFAGRAYCLTEAAGEYRIAHIDNPDLGNWTIATPAFGFTPKVSSFVSTDDAMYILSDDGELFSSTDAVAWASTDRIWANTIGGYGSTLLGLSLSDGAYSHVTFPDTDSTPADPLFPVEGASNSLIFSAEWSSTPQLFIVGGKTASGNYCADTWCYDGHSWNKTSNEPLSRPLSGVTIVDYHYFITNTTDWTYSDYPVILAFGGQTADGQPTKSVYMSYNMGMNWKECPSLMQFPEFIPAFYGAQALVFDSTIRRAESSAPALRITRPVTSWECPYIYLFGGYGDGGLHDTIWRGAINRLYFKPIL